MKLSRGQYPLPADQQQLERAGPRRFASRKGYDFVGSNSTGSNAFFVRSDLPHGLRTYTATDGYIESRLRDSRSESGELTCLTGSERLQLIRDMSVHDLERDAIILLRNIL